MKQEHDSLTAEALAKDPRVAQAKKLLLDAVSDHQKNITGIRPPIPALRQNYEKMLETIAEYRGSKLWFPYLGSGIGNGALVELLDGSVKYDFITGIGTHYWGHSHPEIIAAGIDAAISDTVMQGHLQQNGDTVALSALLLKSSKMDHCFLTSSGAMANENALKIAFQKRFPANRILAFERGFAGRTLALAQVTDKPGFRQGLPETIAVDYVPFYDECRSEESTKHAVEVLKKHLARYPNQHAVMLFELVQGEAGFYPGSREFFVALMEILKQHHISIFDDEIQTFGRTSALFAFQHFGLENYIDLVTIGKLSQVCATLFNADHSPKPGLLSQTFTSSTAAIRASKVILENLIDGGYYGPEGKIMKLHRYFVKKLTELAKQHPMHIRGPFGIGTMIAFTPFDGDSQRTTRIVHALFEAGVMSFIAGTNPTRIRFLIPAGAVTTDDIDHVTKIIKETMLTSDYGIV
jgi:4-aminobutyrate aminotransferase-like enzyme